MALPVMELNRHIASLRARPGQNFVALAFETVQSTFNKLVQNLSQPTDPPAAKAVSGTDPPSDPPSTFTLQVNGQVAPKSIVSLNDALPSAPTGSMATVQWQIDPTLPVPNVSGAYNNLANSLIAGNVVPYSATPVFDASAGNLQKITLTGAVTSFTVINGRVGQTISLVWLQDSAGGHTVAGAPATLRGFTTPGTTLSTYSAQSFTWDGNYWVATGTGLTNF